MRAIGPWSRGGHGGVYDGGEVDVVTRARDNLVVSDCSAVAVEVARHDGERRYAVEQSRGDAAAKNCRLGTTLSMGHYS